MEGTDSSFIAWDSLLAENIGNVLDNPQCPGFEDNKRRIEFILKNMDSELMAKFISDVNIIEKSAKKSYEFRVGGNGFFISTEGSSLDKAVEEYTKSVAHAPTGSQELALAYANRSAVLFKARLISDCLLDIERALQNNYPDNLKAKLYLRKAMCLQILKSKNDPSIKEAFTETRKWAKKMDDKNGKIMEEMLSKQEKVISIKKSTFSKWDGKKSMPKLSVENPKIPGLSDAVEMQYSEKYGRYMVATRDIEPGETVAVQKAYSIVVKSNSRYKFCWNCGEQTWASTPCETCVEVVFCSEICREKGMLEHHATECQVVASLIELNWCNVIFMPLRIVVKGLKEMNNSFETWRRCIEKIDAEKNPMLRGFTKNVLEPDKFSSVYILLGHLEKRMNLTEFDICSSIVVAILLATKTRFFGSRMKNDFETLSSEKNFVFVIGLLEKIIKLSRNNVFRTHVKDIGCRVIIPALSFFNHSCNSMLTRTDHNDYIASRALLPIKKGQQIFDSYGPTYKTMPKIERQKHFITVCNFVCDCEACENNWQQEGPKNMNPLVMESSKLFYDSMKKCEAIRAVREHNFNIEKDVARLSTALQKFYHLHLPPNSYEISAVQVALWELLDLTRNRLLSLD